MVELFAGILIGIGIDIGCQLSMAVRGLLVRLRKSRPAPKFSHDKGVS